MAHEAMSMYHGADRVTADALAIRPTPAYSPKKGSLGRATTVILLTHVIMEGLKGSKSIYSCVVSFVRLLFLAAHRTEVQNLSLTFPGDTVHHFSISYPEDTYLLRK